MFEFLIMKFYWIYLWHDFKTSKLLPFINTILHDLDEMCSTSNTNFVICNITCISAIWDFIYCCIGKHVWKILVQCWPYQIFNVLSAVKKVMLCFDRIAPAHTSLLFREFLVKNNTVSIFVRHGPCEFLMFLKIKRTLKKQSLWNDRWDKKASLWKL